MNKSTDNFLGLDKNLYVEPGIHVNLKKYDSNYTAFFKDKDEAQQMLQEDSERLAELQAMLYAQSKYSLLVILQAMDAAGKDGTIKHVMSGINPQGCEVKSFKAPSAVEMKHDFLWRINKELPAKGMITIFNRSHYEEVLITRVHPEFILSQSIPGINSINDIDDNFWKKRFKQINNFEKHLYESGIIIVKFFLHVSKEEQKNRFLKRIEEPEKNWKFSAKDIAERKYWNKYMNAYEEAITETSKENAPWYIIPADKKWFMRAAVGDILVSTLEKYNLSYPELNKEAVSEFEEAKQMLLNE